MSTSTSAMCWKSCRLLLMKRPSAEMLIVFASARAPAGPAPPPPWTSRLRMTSAAPDPAPASGWREGKFTRSPPPLTGACSSLRELDEQRNAVGRARRAPGVDARILGGDQQPRRLAHCARIARAAATASRAAESSARRRAAAVAGRDRQRAAPAPSAASSRSCTRARPIPRTPAAKPVHRPTSRSRGR